MEGQIRLKGDRQGLRLFLPDQIAFDELMTALQAQLERGEGFFRGADLMVDLGNRDISAEEVAQLAAKLQDWGVVLRAIGTDNRASRGAIRDAGLRSVPSTTAQAPAPAEAHARGGGAVAPDALFVARTVRSGQSIRHHSHVTILGDLNPGAEVVAAGDVLVWGRLRGVVHAGAMGEEKAIVCALDLSPTQLRIAGLAARSPEGGSSAGPEVAHIDQGRIIVEPWDVFRRS